MQSTTASERVERAVAFFIRLSRSERQEILKLAERLLVAERVVRKIESDREVRR